MEFDKSRVYTAANADELKGGSLIAVADTLAKLKHRVERGVTVRLACVENDDFEYRFVDEMGSSWQLAYLVEPAEEKVLKWTNLKVGDIIRTKDGSQTAMVIRINLDDKDSHVNNGFWLRDSDLEEFWEKKED